jgi:hypothetical protein
MTGHVQMCCGVMRQPLATPADAASVWRVIDRREIRRSVGTPGTTGRNVWLRSMKVRLEFEQGQVRLDLGDIFGLTEQMNASGPVAKWQQVLTAMRDNDIAGLELNGDSVCDS